MIFFRRIGHIKALSFDLDDTLYDNFPHMLRAEQALLAYIKKHYPQAQKDRSFWLTHKKNVLKNRPELASDMGELRRLTLTAGMRECGLTGVILSNAVTNCFDYFYFERSNFQVDQKVRQILAELAQHTPLVAITNGNVNLRQIGLQDYFQICFKANLTAPMKPHKHMFELAIAHLKMAPQQILHVGDNMQKDIWGANKAGLKTAWYACNRDMHLSNEQVSMLPDLQLHHLSELRQLIC